jgi:WD40 repeat protein
VAFSLDGRFLATGSQTDLSARLWDAEGRPVGERLPHPSGIRELAFSADSQALLTVGRGKDSRGLVRRWEVPTGRLLETFPQRRGEWLDTTVSPRGTYVAVNYLEQLGAPEILELRDSATGQPVGTPIRQTPFVGYAFLPDEKKVLTVRTLREGDDPSAELRLWDTANARLLALETGPCSGYRPCFAPDGNSFAVVLDSGVTFWDRDSRAQFWDTAILRPLGPPQTFPSPSPGRSALAFHPRGEMVAITTPNGVILVPAPRPLEQDAAHLRLWIEVATGLELDAGGAVVELDAKTWRERWQHLQELGGPP